MTVDQTAPRTRRAILGAALGAAAATVAGALRRPSPAIATDGVALVSGQNNSNASLTAITMTTDATGFDVYGPYTGTGISGRSESGIGVLGDSTSTVASTFVDGSKRVGVMGVGGTLDPGVTYSLDETGVYGHSSIGLDSTGVWGDSFTGYGVLGQGLTGVMGEAFNPGDVAVFGDGDYGATGVYGWTGNPDVSMPPSPVANVAILAVAQNTTYTALQVNGKAKFSRSARKSIGATATSLKVTLAGVTTSSYVIATLQTKVTGCYVQSVVPAAGSFTIYLSKAPGKTVYVAYFVIN